MTAVIQIETPQCPSHTVCIFITALRNRPIHVYTRWDTTPTFCHRNHQSRIGVGLDPAHNLS